MEELLIQFILSSAIGAEDRLWYSGDREAAKQLTPDIEELQQYWFSLRGYNSFGE